MDQLLNNDNIHILNKAFDKIYVIHCVEDEKRYKNVIYQQENSNIDLDIWWTTKSHPFTDQMLNGVLLSGHGRYIINKNELNLLREFYSIIKISYDRGLNRILIHLYAQNVMSLIILILIYKLILLFLEIIF